MRSRTLLFIAAALIICCAITIAHATPIVGVLVKTFLSSGSTNEEIMLHVRVPLPPTDGEDQDGDWTAKLYTSGPTTIAVQDVVFAPGGHTGWHSHPGILLSSVISGSMEWYDSQCNKHVYKPGDSLTENTQTHYVRTLGTDNVHFMVTYVLAKGQPWRIDQPAPACAAALGLD